MAHKIRAILGFLSEAKRDGAHTHTRARIEWRRGQFQFCFCFCSCACDQEQGCESLLLPVTNLDKRAYVPGIKSNIVRGVGTVLLLLSQTRCVWAGHHSTWASPNGCLWLYTACTGTETWVEEDWVDWTGLRNRGREAPRDDESESTPTVFILLVYDKPPVTWTV
jgi:hypothetical protein